MLNNNDMIVHENYGAGTVTGFRTLNHDGKQRRYYTIELIEDRGTLMIPVEAVDNAPLRPTTTFKIVKAEIEKPPEALSDNHRSRRSLLEGKIKSGKPRQIAQALRDLHWRERTNKLTEGDRKLRERAFKLLVEELALESTGALVNEHLTALIDGVMQARLADVEVSAS